MQCGFVPVGTGTLHFEPFLADIGVGPQIVTQDFGIEGGKLNVFITGVAYYDFNANGVYDIGEGIGGVTVTVPGINYYALTSESGGYSIPVPNGNYTVIFTANALSNQFAAVVSAANSVKQDYMPAYTPPVVTGPALASVGQAGAYTFSSVGAATSYQWKQNRRVAFTLVEGAESGLTTNVTATVSGGYPVVTNDVKNSGSFSFHLAHAQPVAQVLSLNRLLRPSSTSQLLFAGRLGFANTGEVARCQISTNGGMNWQDIWTRAGTGGSGESAFSNQTVSLAAFNGQESMLRFVFDHAGGDYYTPGTGVVGFYLDDIAVSNAEELIEPAVTDVASGTAFSFNPASPGEYSLRVRAKVSARILDFGPANLVSASLLRSPKSKSTPGPKRRLISVWRTGRRGRFNCCRLRR